MHITFSSSGYPRDELRVRGGNVSNGANFKHPFKLKVLKKLIWRLLLGSWRISRSNSKADWSPAGGERLL